jgi:FMN-dependent NADH-azoreductase
MKLLRIDASSRFEGSHSRAVADQVVTALRRLHPAIAMATRDLAAEPVEHIKNTTIAGFYTPPESMTPELAAATALSDAIIAEVRDADIILIATPMYNFSIPSALKAWVDQVMRINQTFSYDGKSFTGLLEGKSAFVVVAYGAGGYVANGPFAAADYVTPYLRFLLGFMGIGDVTFIPVEATTGGPETLAHELAKTKALIAAELGGAGDVKFAEGVASAA